MAASGSTALLSDYNDPQATVNSLWRTGSGTRGYGQAVSVSSALTTSTVMGTNEWNNLRYDLFNIRAHQIGTNPAISIAASSGSNVIATDATNFSSYATTYDGDRLTAHVSRINTAAFLPGMGSSMTRTASWASSVQTEFIQNFTSANVKRYFYNLGGKLFFSSSRTGGAASAQNTSWTNLLSAAGTVTIDANVIDGLTGSYTQIYTSQGSNPYASNLWIIEGYTNGPQVYFKITWVDGYTDPSPGNPPLPEDVVDGTLTLNYSYQYAPGGQTLSTGATFLGFSNYFVQPTYSVLSSMVGG